MARPEKFREGIKGAICKKPHKFDKCPILQDINYLRKHFIAYCLMMKRTTNQMELAVNKITAQISKLAADDVDTDTDSTSDSSESETTDDNQDFQQGED